MKRLWNAGWTFLKLAPDAELEQALEQADRFEAVDIPHDWLIYDAQNLYEDSSGWYRKRFEWQETEGDMLVTFDGVYMDSTVYVNGHQVWEWKYGYTSFTVNLSGYLKAGENEIIVCARHKNPNSRWYSGAGIYRNVWVRMAGKSYIDTNGIYVHSKEDGEDFIMTVETRIVGGGKVRHVLERESKAEDKPKTELIFEQTEAGEREGVTISRMEYRVKNPLRWDVESPNLYLLSTVLVSEEEAADECAEKILDCERTRIGFRTIEINNEKGFFLNGRNMKLNGACEHHDLGALGAAFNRAAQKRKYQLLKEMGVNAVRTAHNMVAPECLELADEMGLLVIAEAFDMWEKPKTTYDYARFFPKWHEKDMESFVTRDRNHPCVAFWSIGNEIYDTHADAVRGRELIQDLTELVRRYDPLGNAYTTFGSNYMPWENTQKCAGLLQAVGYNYSEKYYKEHHKKYLDWVIYGSETSSIVQSRGVYHFPLHTGILSDDDEQCSALGNSATSWGAKSVEECICIDRDTPFSMGQFLWSGTDYIGEPTPYHTKNSYFGQIDTAGFPKDTYYMWQSAWTDVHKKPMVHVLPYWDFNPGQTIDVRVCSNADTVELLVNDKSFGRQKLTHTSGNGKHVIADYSVPYEEGKICAVAYDADGRELCRQERYSFTDSEAIVAAADKDSLVADGRDMLFIEIGTVDKDGHPVENAADRVRVAVTGEGRLVGLDNGDSTDYDSYKGTSRRLFNGKLLAMVMATTKAGEIQIQITGKGLKPAGLTCLSRAAEAVEAELAAAQNMEENAAQNTGWNAAQNAGCNAVQSVGEQLTAMERNKDVPVVLGTQDEIPVRKILLRAAVRKITPKDGAVEVTAEILPVNATDREVTFRAVNDSGVTSNLVEVEQIGNRAVITPLGDGAFRLRCVSKSGGDKIRLLSELEFVSEGFGEAYLDPYGFIAGSMYTKSNGNESAGNERGVATARDGETVITFERVDFGKIGSDEITIPIFALDSEAHPIQIWEGIPGEGGELLDEVVYHKQSIWNVYQEDTWKLRKRLTGVASISFLLKDKIHIKGFSFKKEEKAYMRLAALQADEIYGDSFVKTHNSVEQIGNNVTLIYHDMDFGGRGADRITIRGRAPHGANTIHVRFNIGNEEIKQIVEFSMCGDYQEQTFPLTRIEGRWDVSFVFMPGSCFDFMEFVFS